MTRYYQGRAFEYRVQRMLRDNGYVVFRSAGSHTPVDLIAYGRTNSGVLVLFVQCKASDKPTISKKERCLLTKWERKFGALAMIAYKGQDASLQFEGLDGNPLVFER